MKRVVITGIGAVSPVGLGADEYFAGLLAGEAPFATESAGYPGHGAGGLSARLSPALRARVVSQVDDPTLTGDGARFAVCATLQACADAGLPPFRGEDGRVPVYMGNSEGDPAFLEAFIAGREQLGDLSTLGFQSDAIPRAVARRLKLTGPTVVFHNTCASSVFALEAGVTAVRHGKVAMALCGASDPFSLKIWTGFGSLQALGPNGCKAFAADRKGIVIAEGAFMFVVEDADLAVARGARIYTEVLGIGLSNDASHLTNPDVSGVALAIERAMSDARIEAREVDAVFAHATGTVANDKTESEALRQRFAPAPLPVVATKATLGHMMSAAAAANVAAACLAFRSGALPPSKRSEPLAVELMVPVVCGTPLPFAGKTVLVHGFGFGGNNGVVVLRAWDKP